jgi:hypothetical protein
MNFVQSQEQTWPQREAATGCSVMHSGGAEGAAEQ